MGRQGKGRGSMHVILEWLRESDVRKGREGVWIGMGREGEGREGKGKGWREINNGWRER